jgi:hypothetical protein
MSTVRRLPVPAALGAGVGLGLIAVFTWVSITSGQGAVTTARTADRASLEQLLAERPVTPTGQTRRFDLTVKPKVGTRSPSASAAPSSASPREAPSHTMVPDMTQMPGMGDMPGMTH